MSKTPQKPLPAHLRPLTLDIPATWTPQQPLPVFELIDDLPNKICALSKNGPPRRHEWKRRRSLAGIVTPIGGRLKSPPSADDAPVELWATPF
jgi:hypothetical protein